MHLYVSVNYDVLIFLCFDVLMFSYFPLKDFHSLIQKVHGASFRHHPLRETWCVYLVILCLFFHHLIPLLVFFLPLMVIFNSLCGHFVSSLLVLYDFFGHVVFLLWSFCVSL